LLNFCSDSHDFQLLPIWFVELTCNILYMVQENIPDKECQYLGGRSFRPHLVKERDVPLTSSTQKAPTSDFG
jgi:hypothetical protein